MQQDKYDQGHHWKTFYCAVKYGLQIGLFWEENVKDDQGLEEGNQFRPNTLQLKNKRVEVSYKVIEKKATISVLV